MAVKLGTDPNIPVGRSMISAISISGYLQSANNLSDVQSASAARANLGISDPGNFQYTYVAFADSIDGGGFTTTYSDSKLFWAIKVSSTELTPVVSDFVNLWVPFEKHRDDQLATYDNYRIINPGDDLLFYNSLGLGQQAMMPIAYHYKGTFNRVYFVIYESYKDSAGVIRSGHSTQTHVFYLDLDTGELSPPITIPQVYPTSTDYHDLPAIIVTDDGSIIICKEELTSGGFSHNSEMEIWKSNAPETIEDPGSPGNHYFTKVLLLPVGSSGLYAYPKLLKTQVTGEMMLFLRANGGDGQARFCVIKSTDNGSTWKDLQGTSDVVTEIADGRDIIGSSSLSWFLYNYPCKGSREQGYHVFFISNEGTAGGVNGPDGNPSASRGKLLLYLQSDDGITWKNDANYFLGTGGFTKNVISSGAITPAELLANCVIEDVSTDADHAITVLDAWVDNDGNPSAIIIDYDRRHSSQTPNYINKANILYGSYIIRYNRTTDVWDKMSLWELLKHPLSTTGITVGDVPTWGVRTAYVSYGDGRFDVMADRVYEGVEKYADALTEITSTADLVTGLIYRIVATTTDNFGSGLIVGDYYTHGTATCDASNRLVPVKMETVFWRTTDYGENWFMVRDAMRMWHDQYCVSNSPIATSSCMYNSGYLFFFRGLAQRLNAASTAHDHSEFAIFINKIQL